MLVMLMKIIKYVNNRSFLLNATCRNSHSWVYRTKPKPSTIEVILAEILGGFTWFWVLYKGWHNFDEIIGHFPYPNPNSWSDEELGIPQTEEEIIYAIQTRKIA